MRGNNHEKIHIIFIAVLSISILGLCMGVSASNKHDNVASNPSPNVDDWANAIFKAEGGYKATYLYGIRSIPYETEAQARRYCKNTVLNTLVKYRAERCESGESDIDCLARRYCPVGSDTDNGTCQHWKSNVKHFLKL